VLKGELYDLKACQDLSKKLQFKVLQQIEPSYEPARDKHTVCHVDAVLEV